MTPFKVIEDEAGKFVKQVVTNVTEEPAKVTVKLGSATIEEKVLAPGESMDVTDGRCAVLFQKA